METLFRINIRQFDEESPSFITESGDLDVESILNTYQQEQEQEQVPEDEVEDEVEVVDEEQETVEEEIEPEETDDLPKNQGDEKRTADQAFAEMRRKVEANEPLAQWVQDLAIQQGFQDPKELIEAYEQQRLAKEAEAEGVPVDVYQRLHQLEQENKLKTEETKNIQFNHEVEQTKSKYNLSDEQLSEVFKFMGQRGYDAGDIPFEDAYVLANRDTLIKDAEERGRQAYLEEQQQKQQQATPIIGTNANDKQGTDELDMSKESIFNTFKEMGIPID